MMYLVHSVRSNDEESGLSRFERLRTGPNSQAGIAALQGPIAVIAISAIAAFGITLWAIAPFVGKTFLFIVVFGGIVGFWFGKLIRPRRKSVAVIEGGFRVDDRHGSRLISDDQVTSYALSRRRHYRRGKPTHVTRELTLWIEAESGPDKIALKSASMHDEGAALDLAIDRIRTMIKERSATNRHQHVFDGDGWSFEHDELRFDRFGPDYSICLKDISAIEEIDGAILIWDQQRAKPIGRIPVGTRNADLLKTVVDEYLLDAVERQRSTTSETAAHTSLGRLLFERTSSRLARWAIVSAGIAVLLIGMVLTVIAISHQMPIFAVAAALFALAGILMTATGFFYAKTVFQAFENGIRQQSFHGEYAINFDEIGTLTYQTKPEHIHHIYSGLQTRMVVTPLDAQSQHSVDFIQSGFHPDESLIMIRDRASFAVARRMRVDHSAGRVVDWVPGIELGVDGILSAPKRRWYQSQATEEVPYDSINSVQFKGDALIIWTDYQERAVLKISASEPNFYPGYYLLAWILQIDVH